jgi:pilus assembly protein CpaF
MALDGPLSIRRFGANPLKLEDLLNYKAFTPEMAMLLEACIKARLNIVISGGTGCGKTTLLNTLSSFIPHDERIVTIEDAAELAAPAGPRRPPGNAAARTSKARAPSHPRPGPQRPAYAARTHHHRRVPRSEALDMLQAMNTGHSGS